nr:hypothetical protein [Helicobacter labetoulli]
MPAREAKARARANGSRPHNPLEQRRKNRERKLSNAVRKV